MLVPGIIGLRRHTPLISSNYETLSSSLLQSLTYCHKMRKSKAQIFAQVL